MNKIIILVLSVVALYGAVTGTVALVGDNQSVALGAEGTRFPQGISADSTSPVNGEVRGTDLTITDDATISGGTATVTTSNTATSTVIAGCYQTTATSTASPIKLEFTSSFSSTTTFPTGTNIDGATGGLVAWSFGSCPGL